MSSQPARQFVCAAGYFAVQPDSGNAAEVVLSAELRVAGRLVWCGRLVCNPQWSDNSEIDRASVALSGAEPSPRRERVAHAAQPKGVCKIVTAAGRDDQQRYVELHQLTEMPVDGAIATEEQDDVRLLRSSRRSDAPVDAPVGLERIEILRRTSQPEDGGGAHVRGRE